MIYFFGIFSDIFAACGTILGGLIVAVLALLVIAFYIVVALACVIIALGVIYAIYYWSRYCFYRLRH